MQKSVEQKRAPRNGPSTLWSTSLPQSRKEYPMEKRQSIQQMCWENWTAKCRRMKLDHFLTSYTKTNSKWMKDLNVWLKAINFLEGNIYKNLLDISCRNIFLDMPPLARETKGKLNYWDYNKGKSFCTAMETINKTKGQSTEWEKIWITKWSIW